MNLLVLDGNSIINRAFYGIKLLTTKNGTFTNGIYGFLNILIRLKEECQPDAVAIAFDLKAPTFRHKMYEGYKAGRHAMPPELAEQMPILKELLTLLGYTIVTKEGYEADDILGTLAGACTPEDHCYIATGDRDSLQLVRDNVTVLLASTKMGKPQTVRYTPEVVKETYLVDPPQLIEVKGLMGDSSDKIPGVAGIGQKTAGDLISKYHDIDYIYEHLEELDIKPGVRAKLQKDKDNAFLSRTLGTICCEVPIDTNLESYIPGPGDATKAARMLASLEMFGILDKLGLQNQSLEVEPTAEEEKKTLHLCTAFSDIAPKLEEDKQAVFEGRYEGAAVKGLCFVLDGEPYLLNEDADFNGFDVFLENPSIAKAVPDAKALYHYGLAKQKTVTNIRFDASLVGYILNPAANDYSPIRLYEEYQSAGKFASIAVDSEEPLVKETLALHAIQPYLLACIDSNNQGDLLGLEISLAEVLASMEHLGFLVDAEGLRAYGEEISAKVTELTHRIYEEVGYEFNLNSPKQLGKALFEDLGLPPKKKTKSGYSTNAEVLEELAGEYPVVADILEYRTVSKLKSTYCDGLLKVIAADGRIHSTLNQTETRTGRISSSEPNLQNIPVRKPIGSELRKFFIAKEGYTLVDADYSQIELRVLAHMAQDKNMIAAFESGEDIHAVTASQVFGVPLDYVTPLMRSNAKAVNFGIIYGMGAFSLSKDIGVSRKEAQAYIDGYLGNFSGVNSFMENVVEEAREKGYCKTLYERRRYLPELTASNHMVRAAGERVARNAPIQGTAADIIKIAMVKVYNRLQAEQLDARLIMQIHDELIVEAREDLAEQVCHIVEEEMEHACALSVKLSVDAHTGKSWYEAKG